MSATIRASLPSLSHTTLSDWSHVYEPSEDTFLLCDALARDAPRIRTSGARGEAPALVLELGSGSGVVSAVLLGLLRTPTPPAETPRHQPSPTDSQAAPCALCIAVDVSGPACVLTLSTARAAGVGARLDAVRCDFLGPLAARLKGAADIVVWNPPYVPTPADEVPSVGELASAGFEADPLPAAWAGGDRGRTVIDRVLPCIPLALRRPAGGDKGGVAYILLLEENAPMEIAEMLATHGLRAEIVETTRAANELLHVLRVTWI